MTAREYRPVCASWPAGCLARFAAWWKVLVNAFLFVAGIEVFQLFSSFGAFDVDDLLLNCFGAMLGYWGWLVFRKKA